MDWTLRGCARHGHDTFAPDEADLAAGLRADTPQGEAWRCLRCGAFVIGAPAGRGPAADAPAPLRGKAARDAVILRFLAAERGIRAVLILLAAYLVVRFRHSQASLRDLLDKAVPAARPLANVLHYDLDHSSTITHLRHVVDTNPRTLTVVALALAGYAAVEGLEAVGLWMLKRWGEYVAVVGTAAFIPLEVYEVVDKSSAFKAVTLAINLAAVVWLLWSKRLFGIRGGGSAYEAERASANLLEITHTAEAAPSEPVVTAGAQAERD